MKCKNCGNEICESAKFCKNCGEVMNAEVIDEVGEELSFYTLENGYVYGYVNGVAIEELKYLMEVNQLEGY